MRRMLISVSVLLTMTGCACLTDFSYRQDATGRIHLAQCWSKEDQEQFYTTSQGSHIAPYKIATHVELPDRQEKFLTPENIKKWGYLEGKDYSKDSKGEPLGVANKDGWPLGFVKDTVESGEWKGEWIGMTCAACHTTEIHYKKKNAKIRIDGGPTMADFSGFFNELDASLEETWKDGQKEGGRDGKKFERYLSNFTSNFTEEERKGLLERLKKVVDERKAWHKRNNPELDNRSVSSHGYARLDAFGVIFNEVSEARGNTKDIQAPAAPVSYPFIWDTHYHVWTQWNGVSAAIPMGRNVGQVLGVFGKVNVKSGESSIRVSNLHALQNLVSDLRSPKWPEDKLEPINRDKASKGQKIFEVRCQSCHEIQKRNMPLTIPPLSTTIDVQMTELHPRDPKDAIGTDETMATNAARKSTTDGIPMKDNVGKTVKRVIFHLRYLEEAVLMVFDAVVAFFKQEFEQPKPLAYKARPLNGIWATAPYLHNGSVPNLYELLRPTDKRMKTFYVGSREFDPEKVGFATDDKSGTLLDTSVTGNLNKGHDDAIYGGELTEDEIWQLVEYMKTL